MSTVVGAPARAADSVAPKTLRIGVVTASDSYLVFRQKVATRSGFSFLKGSTLYFKGRTGEGHALRDFDPEMFPDLKGSMLTQSAEPNYKYDYDNPYNPKAPEYVRWRDLRTGKHGIAELPAGDDYVASAPGGWLATRAPADGSENGAQHIVQYTTAGHVTDLGAPFPAGVPTTAVLRGSAGVLAVSARDPERYSEDSVIGAFRYVPYKTPGKWRNIIKPNPAVSAYCGRPSNSHVVCELYGVGSTHSGQVLIPLAGGTRRWLDSHPKTCQTIGLTVVGSSAFGISSSTGRGCVKGQVIQLTSRGTFKTSKRMFSSGGGAGLGGFLVVSKDARTILRLTSAGGVPKAVTTAH